MAANFGTIGNAYVQIMPSTKGIGASLNKEMGEAGNVSGEAAGTNLVGKIKGLIAKAAIGTMVVKVLGPQRRRTSSFEIMVIMAKTKSADSTA